MISRYTDSLEDVATLVFPAPLQLKRYLAFGLEIASEIELPELAPCIAPAARPADVWIHFATVPPTPSDGTGGNGIDHDRFVLSFDSAARFRVYGGHDIAIDPHPGSSERAGVRRRPATTRQSPQPSPAFPRLSFEQCAASVCKPYRNLSVAMSGAITGYVQTGPLPAGATARAAFAPTPQRPPKVF